MSYHSLMPLVADYCKFFTNPQIFEIGIEFGNTPLTLTSWMGDKDFNYAGVDIKIPQSLLDTLCYSDLKNHNIHLMEANSLKYLPKLVKEIEENNQAFPIFTWVLVDGDHNYHTVKQELDYLVKFTDKYTVFLCDDYNGKWSEKDLYYSERETHKEVDATPVVDTEQKGVRAAVDEFLKENDNYQLMDFRMHDENGEEQTCEAVLLIRKDNEVNFHSFVQQSLDKIKIGKVYQTNGHKTIVYGEAKEV